MAYTKTARTTRALGSAVLAGTLTLGLAHHLRAQDPARTAPAASSERSQSVESAYRDAFQHMKARYPGERPESIPGVSSLKRLAERFPNSTEALLVAANLSSFAPTGQSFDSAIKLYDRVIALDPKNVAAYVNKGIAIGEMTTRGEFPETAAAADRGDAPGALMGILSRDKIIERLRKGKELALPYYDAALRLDPKNFAANYDKGLALNVLGRPDEAIECFKRAASAASTLKYLGNRVPTMNEEGSTPYLFAPEGECGVSAAIKYIVDNECSTAVQGNVVVRLDPSQVYISNGKDALAFCEYHMGICYTHDSKAKNYDTALDHFKKAVSANPNVPLFYLFESEVDKESGALEDLQKGRDVMQRIRDLLLR